MGRRFVIAAIVVLAFVAAGAGVAVLTTDDGDDTASGTTTTSRGSAGPSTTATTASTTTTTTTPPSTTTTRPQGPGGLPDPCGAEGGAITAAVQSAVEGAADRAQVEECRLAAIDESWASVRLVARPGADFGALTVVLQGGGGAWAVVATGTGDVGCADVPQQVLVDLGIVCTSGGGT